MKTMKKSLISLFSAVILAAMCIIPVASADFQPVERTKALVVDEAGVLTDDELTSLNQTAESIAANYPYEVAVVFVESTDGQYIRDFADDYYDYNGYGAGKDDDGMLLLVAVEDREYWITCHAKGSKMFDDDRIEGLEGSMLYNLRQNAWGDAANSFLGQAEYYLDQGMPGIPLPALILMDLVLGMLIALVPMGFLKAQIFNVRPQREAGDYVPEGGVIIDNSRDVYLHTTVHRERIESSSGSSHTSSSGRSHTGGGGSF